ncbi:hypothetical protein [Furfurilactobacillus rossiae]|uniref:Lipoprotein n=1 Tax=Furfurilactobacillus rossiae DSM 15814 TaxID=1114972 RepID=A0A0R1RL36_9LACO|nr:hypothetical protein [Furfurilactobacillus rossiae]KRL54315.1 hypothetical protein FD35_GL002652 [Furfurilactobacillus rossiae DSM 15814]QFR66956.1 hypothetical protein LR814_07530 [Furfurilactobacillus rossiae]QLE62456.1 hypothetical protein LROSRS0_2411 [Furfurilactobacillus rossiae]
MAYSRKSSLKKVGIALIGVALTLTLSGCKSVSSSGSKKDNVKESKKTEKIVGMPVKNKSNFTVNDLKQHPKMSATAITLYGDTHIPSSHSKELSSTDRTNFEKGFSLFVRIVNSTTAKYSTNSDKMSQFNYYSLVGSDHDQVSYFDARDKILLKVSLAKVVNYLNKTLTSAETTTVADKVTINSKTNGDTDQSQTAKDEQSLNNTNAVAFLQKLNDSSTQGADIVGETYVIYTSEPGEGIPVLENSGAVTPPDSIFVAGNNRSGAGAMTGVVLTNNHDGTITVLMCNGIDLNPYIKAIVQEGTYKVLSRQDLGIQGSLTEYFGGFDKQASEERREMSAPDSDSNDSSQNNSDGNNDDSAVSSDSSDSDDENQVDSNNEDDTDN